MTNYSTGEGTGTPIVISDNGSATNCPDCYVLGHCPSVSLGQWGDYMALNPYYLYQFGLDPYLNLGTPIPTNDGIPCNAVTFETSQGGQIVGRNEIYNALLRADELIHDYVGYWPDAKYGFSADEINFKQAYTGGHIRLKDSKLKALGREMLTLIDTITIDTSTDITDDDGDNLLDTITLTVPVVALVNVDDLAVFFVADDWRYPERCRNELRPLTIAQSGTNWLITFPAWLAVKPILYSGQGQTPLDPADLTLYATIFNVYRRWTDESQAVMIGRRPIDCTCGRTGDCYTCTPGTACIVNAERGIIELRFAETDICLRCIDKLCVFYRGGGPGYPEIVANLAAAYLRRPICCESTSGSLSFQQADYIGLDTKGKIVTTLTDSERVNPFGTTRGGVDAFRFFRQKRVRKAIRV